MHLHYLFDRVLTVAAASLLNQTQAGIVSHLLDDDGHTSLSKCSQWSRLKFNQSENKVLSMKHFSTDHSNSYWL